MSNSQTSLEPHPAHTPGPWRAVKGSEDDSERWQIVFDGAYSWIVATVENGQPGDTLETEGHTAHLIAAAPELLEALKEADRILSIERQSTTADDPRRNLLSQICSLTADAISKAERGGEMIHVQTAHPQQDTVQFPALMISQETACLVLASAGDAVNLIGVCLHPGASEHHYGDIRALFHLCRDS